MRRVDGLKALVHKAAGEVGAPLAISIIASTFGVGIRFKSAEAPRMFSIATRIGAPLTSH